MMLNEFSLAPSLLHIINSEQAHNYRIIPIGVREDLISFKSDNPTPDLVNELEIVLNKKIELLKDSKENIDRLLSYNYRLRAVSSNKSFHFTNDFLEKIIQTAKDLSSSDIHFEPYETSCRIRYRIDGKLKEYFRIPKDEYPIILNKLKIQAGMDISEKRLPQDGRITIKTGLDEYDIRASSLPTLYGEKVVLRLLGKDASNIQLEDLGFSSCDLKIYKEGIRKPNGIILISGPTGSGKTTTLYATLKLLNDSNNNILTIEDPIEYTLEGINQVQLKENIGLDFPSTLRTFLRQDPDIIMVGEIRDVKTANMAIRAALTGHLVLSTIHTNSAWGTISRLIDMGVPSFLIATTLNLSVAQRLVRKLCSRCKVESEVIDDLFPENFTLPRPLFNHCIANGCNKCHHTGYDGRIAIYEILSVDKDLIPLIKGNQLEIDGYIQNNGIMTLKNRAFDLIESGITSVEEIYPLLQT